MEKITFPKRFIKAISDFNFVNTFVHEKTGRAIKFMLTCYLGFVLVLGIYTWIFIGPVVSDNIDQIATSFEQMPSFTIENGELLFDEPVDYRAYGEANVIVDLDFEHDDTYYAEEEITAFVIRKGGIYIQGQQLFSFDMMPLDNQSEIVEAIRSLKMMFYLALVFVALLGIIGVFILSLLGWSLVIIINGFMRKDIDTSACYRVGIYALTLPSLILLLTWVLNLVIPYMTLFYIALTSLYAYMYLKQYSAEDFNMENIYE